VTGLSRRLPVARVVAVVFAVQAVAVSLLPVVAGSTARALTGVVCFGIGFGVATIARPALQHTTRSYTPVLLAVAACNTLAALAIAIRVPLHRCSDFSAPRRERLT
jgi:hypothetical protein